MCQQQQLSLQITPTHLSSSSVHASTSMETIRCQKKLYSFYCSYFIFISAKSTLKKVPSPFPPPPPPPFARENTQILMNTAKTLSCRWSLNFKIIILVKYFKYWFSPILRLLVWENATSVNSAECLSFFVSTQDAPAIKAATVFHQKP